MENGQGGQGKMRYRFLEEITKTIRTEEQEGPGGERRDKSLKKRKDI